jgi:soluble cytochrome b562
MDWVERDILTNQKYAPLCKKTLQSNQDEKNKLVLNLTKIKNQALDVTKGKMDKALKEQVQHNPDLVVDEWIRKYAKNMDHIDKTQNEGENFRLDLLKRWSFLWGKTN